MSQQNPKKIFALIISLAAHGALIYYLGQMALDYALPDGTVTTVEMNYEAPQGNQLENMDVAETNQEPKIAPTETPAPKEASKAPVAVVAPVAPSPKSLPEKITPKENLAAAVPEANAPDAFVAKVPDSGAPAVDPFSEELDQKNLETAAEESQPKEDLAALTATAVPSANAPTDMPPSPEAPQAVPDSAAIAAPQVSSARYGSADGVLSDAVLSPVSGNKKISYPTMARFRKLEGETVVHYTVSGDGSVTDVKLVKSSGHDVLDDSVMETIKGWKFKPTGREGVYERPVQFSLKGEAVPAPSQLRRNPR